MTSSTGIEDYESDTFAQSNADHAGDVDGYDQDTAEDAGGRSRSRGSTAAASGANTASTSTKQVGRDKALIRRALAKHAQITNADDAARMLAGEMVGVDGTDADDLTVAILTASKSQSSTALADLAALRTEGDMEAAAMAATMPNERVSALWRVLVALGGASGAKPSGSGVNRALNVVKAARGLSDEQVASLDDAVALTKKTV